MRLALLAALGGLVLGFLRGGRPANLPAERLRWPVLAFLAVWLYWAPSLDVASSAALLLVLVSYAALLTFAAANLRLVGMAVVAIGLGLNALVILVNGGMPVDPDAVVATGLAQPHEIGAVDLGAGRQWQVAGEPLGALGDIVPVAPLDEVVSFGDLVLAAGLANVVFRLLLPVAGRQSRSAGRDRHRPEHRVGPPAVPLSPAG